MSDAILIQFQVLQIFQILIESVLIDLLQIVVAQIQFPQICHIDENFIFHKSDLISTQIPEKDKATKKYFN